jgi:lysyl-tRNA synthetase class I
MVAKLTYRLFSKFGNPKTSGENHKEFSKRFQATFAETLLESHLKILFDRHTKFVGSKCLNFVIKFVSQATKIKCTMARLKPFMENILYQTVIPIMMVSERDIQLFSEDPIEYIRK